MTAFICIVCVDSNCIHRITYAYFPFAHHLRSRSLPRIWHEEYTDNIYRCSILVLPHHHPPSLPNCTSTDIVHSWFQTVIILFSLSHLSLHINISNWITTKHEPGWPHHLQPTRILPIQPLFHHPVFGLPCLPLVSRQVALPKSMVPPKSRFSLFSIPLSFLVYVLCCESPSPFPSLFQFMFHYSQW